MEHRKVCRLGRDVTDFLVEMQRTDRPVIEV